MLGMAEPEVVALVDAAFPDSDKGLELTSEQVALEAPDALDDDTNVEAADDIPEFAPTVLFSIRDFSECLIIVQWSLTFSGSWGLITKFRRFSGSGIQH